MLALTRRRLLAAAGVGAMSSVAGCLGGDEPQDESENGGGSEQDDEDSEDTLVSSESDEPEFGPLLGDITVDNLHDEPHDIDVQVEIDGETEAWETVSLDAREGGVTLERTWPANADTFRVIVRIDQSEIRQRRPSDWNDPDCVNLLIVVDREGELRIAGDTVESPCTSDT